MPIPAITPINIAGGSTTNDIETAINSLIDQRIVSGTMTNGGLTLTTDDGNTVVIPMFSHVQGIVTGLAITRTGALNYSVAVGSYNCNGEIRTVAAPVALAAGARGVNPRFDLVVGDDTGAVTIVAGTPSPTPVYPAIAANQVILHVLAIPASSSPFLDGAVASFNSNTQTFPAITVDGNGVLSLGGGIIKPVVASYSAAGNVDLTTNMHSVDSAIMGFAIDMPAVADAGAIEGITYTFIDTGAAGANNWDIDIAGGGGTIATATTAYEVIRITFIAGGYVVG